MAPEYLSGSRRLLPSSPIARRRARRRRIALASSPLLLGLCLMLPLMLVFPRALADGRLREGEA